MYTHEARKVKTVPTSSDHDYKSAHLRDVQDVLLFHPVILLERLQQILENPRVRLCRPGVLRRGITGDA